MPIAETITRTEGLYLTTWVKERTKAESNERLQAIDTIITANYGYITERSNHDLPIIASWLEENGIDTSQDAYCSSQVVLNIIQEMDETSGVSTPHILFEEIDSIKEFKESEAIEYIRYVETVLREFPFLTRRLHKESPNGDTQPFAQSAEYEIR